MYKQVETHKTARRANGAQITPVATLEDEHTGIIQIWIDDGCYQLGINNSLDGCLCIMTHIPREAFLVLKQLPDPRQAHSTQAAFEMPKYRCHKEVRAMKISRVMRGADGGYGAVIELVMPVETYKVSDFTVDVDHDYIKKHDPAPGDYYVVYRDGYCSCSPAEAFENGYTLIEG